MSRKAQFIVGGALIVLALVMSAIAIEKNGGTPPKEPKPNPVHHAPANQARTGFVVNGQEVHIL